MTRLIRPDIPKIVDAFGRVRPAGGAAVVSIDAPWDYSNFSEKGEGKNAKKHYPCMTADDIATIPVDLLCAKDVAVFAWFTWPTMPIWNDVIRGWGLDFAGLAWEWIKYNPATGKYAFGPGYGTRKNLEPCLLLTRGNPHLRRPLEFFGVQGPVSKSRSVRDFIQAMPLDCIRQPRREHSRKPDEHFDRIETMFEGPYVELFSRQERNGWHCWGDELEKFEAKT